MFCGFLTLTINFITINFTLSFLNTSLKYEKNLSGILEKKNCNEIWHLTYSENARITLKISKMNVKKCRFNEGKFYKKKAFFLVLLCVTFLEFFINCSECIE